MKNMSFLFLSILIVAGLLLTACGGETSATTAATAAQQSTEASAAAAATAAPSAGGGSTNLVLDPANVPGEKNLAFVGYMYEGLMRVKDGAPVGALAQSYTISEDGLDYIFNLRPGVTFHDGTTLDADVVTANFNRWFDPKDANRGSGEFATWAKTFGGFKGETAADGKAKSIYDGIEKVNNMTVLVHLNTQDANFPTKLSDPAFSIVSPKAFKGGDGGTGAYKFVSISGSTATLEPFAAYWDAKAVPGKNLEVPVK